MERDEVLIKVRKIVTDLREKAENVKYEVIALEELVDNLEQAIEMLEKGEDGYVYLQIGEHTLGSICHIDMYDLKDIDIMLEDAKEVLYKEAD